MVTYMVVVGALMITEDLHVIDLFNGLRWFIAARTERCRRRQYAKATFYLIGVTSM